MGSFLLRFMRRDWTAGDEAPHATRGNPLLHTFPGIALPGATNADWAAALALAMTAYDKLFLAAKAKSEFDYVLAMVHHEHHSNHDPYKTTREPISVAWLVVRTVSVC